MKLSKILALITAIVLSVVLMMFITSSSFGEWEAPSPHDTIAEALIKTQFNQGEDFFAKNFIEDGLYSQLMLVYAKRILTQINNDKFTPLIAVTDGANTIRILSQCRFQFGVSFLGGSEGFFKVGDKTFLYEILGNQENKILFTAATSDGDYEITLNMRSISLDPLKIRVKFDVFMDGNETDVRYEAYTDKSGNQLVLLFEYDNFVNFSYKASDGQAITFFDLAKEITSKSAEPTLTEISESVGSELPIVK